MFDKAMVPGLVAVVLAVTMFGGRAMAQVVLPTGLAPGSEYEIGHAGSESSISTTRARM